MYSENITHQGILKGPLKEGAGGGKHGGVADVVLALYPEHGVPQAAVRVEGGQDVLVQVLAHKFRLHREVDFTSKFQQNTK